MLKVNTPQTAFGSIVLANSGKKGILKPNDKGFYRLNAGAFNVENANGIPYPANDYIQSQMDENSDLNRRVSMGYCKMEVEHPKPIIYVVENGIKYMRPMTDMLMWINRLRTYDDTNICGLIGKIYFFPEDNNDLTKPIWNEIECKPFGPRGPEFKESLEEPAHNTAVSIRTQISLFEDGDKFKNVEYWTGYDWVSEPGMVHANKHMSAGCESLLSDLGLKSNMRKFKTSDVIEALENQISGANINKEALEMRGGMEALDHYKGMLERIKSNYHPGETVSMGVQFGDIF